MSELQNALIIAGVFFAIFAAGEGVRLKWPDKKEAARKTVHFLSGLTVLSFPYLFKSHWLVLGLALGFFLIIQLAAIAGKLNSIHGVGRSSKGAIYFPLSVYLIFYLAQGKPFLFVIPILVLTISDTLAALMGKTYGRILYDVEDDKKSLEGSMVFLLATYLCVLLPLLLMTEIGRLEAILLSLIIALLVTGFEAVSLSGADNVFIPFGTYFVLMKMTEKPQAEIITQTQNLLLVIFVVLFLTLSLRILKLSAAVLFILLDYAAWSLCNIYWLIPLAIFQITYLLLVYVLQRKNDYKHAAFFQIKAVFYTGIVPAIMIFIANALRDNILVYTPYLTAIASQMAILCSVECSTCHVAPPAASNGRGIYHSVLWGILTLLLVAAFPLWLYGISNPTRAFAIIASCSVAAQAIHFLIRNFSKFQHQDEQSIKAPARVISSSIVSFAALAIQIMLP